MAVEPPKNAEPERTAEPPSIQVARAFIAAFAGGDLADMARHLAPALDSGITNAAGGVDAVAGRDAFMARLAAMNVKAVRPRIEITQIIEARPGEVLAMVEINARHGHRTLHNFGAFLLTVEDGAITRFRMVDAKPAESDAFWLTHTD